MALPRHRCSSRPLAAQPPTSHPHSTTTTLLAPPPHTHTPHLEKVCKLGIAVGDEAVDLLLAAPLLVVAQRRKVLGQPRLARPVLQHEEADHCGGRRGAAEGGKSERGSAMGGRAAPPARSLTLVLAAPAPPPAAAACPRAARGGALGRAPRSAISRCDHAGAAGACARACAERVRGEGGGRSRTPAAAGAGKQRFLKCDSSSRAAAAAAPFARSTRSTYTRLRRHTSCVRSHPSRA